MAPSNGNTVTQMIVKRLDRIEDKVDQLMQGQIALKVKMAYIGGAAGLIVSGTVTPVARLLS
jgi:hypothetical protein